VIDRENFTMRAPCKQCSGTVGRIVERNRQDTVRCASCGVYQYNAPRVETGREQRSVTTVHEAIRPKQRARILSRASARCEVCGARGNLHVGHIVSVAIGLNFGMTEVELNDDENLLCLCEECNLGQGKEPMPLRVAMVVLRARIAWRDQMEAS
jgi:5-methylcytosine-specific restriction endonuclease McrA